MSLVIRFANNGRRGERKYKLVVVERRSRRDGRPIELLGTFEKRVGNVVEKNFDDAKIKAWVSKGAQLSTGARKIINPQQ